MRRITRGLAIACTCAAATASFAGVALADKATAPGQDKQDGAAQAQAAAGVSTSVAVGVDASTGRSELAHAAAPGQAKQDSSTTATAEASAGVKPSSSTTSVMWSQCTTGGVSTSATCTATRSTAAASVKADASKQYGSGDTAAGIAVARGGAGAVLTGPGNSQPHKVSLCGRPANPSGGVDVHAVKRYSSSACQASPQPDVTATVASQAAVEASTTVQAGATVQAAPATQAGSTSPTSSPASGTTNGATNGTGGVLAAHASVTKPKGGVLGEVTNVAGSTLPFTGFPLWLVALAALGLIGGGLALRRGAAAHA